MSESVAAGGWPSSADISPFQTYSSTAASDTSPAQPYTSLALHLKKVDRLWAVRISSRWRALAGTVGGMVGLGSVLGAGEIDMIVEQRLGGATVRPVEAGM